ncbi:MAG: cytochrome d ubiquinol oxidase subunit II [Alphaproteobacteria bacterium]|nr:cytochrome d ubiquinol oxidase subunit II [Alphaproteobacteria bacterium]
MPIPFDYETLRLIWWALLGVLLIGLAVMDGFDMGAAFLNPFIARTDDERRAVINTVGPVWEGNQVWLVTGGGAIFAAFPMVYAAAFSGFYVAMLLVLLSLILRPVSFEFRNKFPQNRRGLLDGTLFLSGLVPPLVFGVAFGNLFQGVPFHLDGMQLVHYVPPAGWQGWAGGFFGLLNPFGLLCGLVSVAMLTAHGAVFVAGKTDDAVRARAAAAAKTFTLLWALLFVIGGLWVGHINGYRLVGEIAHNGPSDPTLQHVTRLAGVWLENYNAHPALYAVPLLALLAAIATLGCMRAQRFKTAFVASALTVSCTIATAGIALFPFLMPSSLEPNDSLTVWDASSSRLTLWLMTLAAAVFVAVILAYTSWVYRVLRGPVTTAHVRDNSNALY